MPLIDCRVSVKEQTLETLQGLRQGPRTRMKLAYKDRPDLTFIVQGDLPSQCQRAAQDAARQRFGHTHDILSVNITDARGRAVAVVIKPRVVG